MTPLDFARQVAVPLIEPKKGVTIETDPKAAKQLPSATDDETVIDSLIAKLTAARASLPTGFKLAPIQVWLVCCVVKCGLCAVQQLRALLALWFT